MKFFKLALVILALVFTAGIALSQAASVQVTNGRKDYLEAN